MDFEGMTTKQKNELGCRRILRCLALLSKDKEEPIVDIPELQKCYLRLYERDLNKEECRILFGQVRHQGIFLKFMADKVEMSTDSNKNGSLFLKLKCSIEEALGEENPIEENLPEVTAKIDEVKKVNITQPIATMPQLTTKEGSRRILYCLAQLSKDKEEPLVHLQDFQKRYFIQYGRDFNKQERLLLFGQHCIKGIFHKFMADTVELCTDQNMNGSLYLKLKCSIEEALGGENPAEKNLPKVAAKIHEVKKVDVAKSKGTMPKLIPKRGGSNSNSLTEDWPNGVIFVEDNEENNVEEEYDYEDDEAQYPEEGEEQNEEGAMNFLKSHLVMEMEMLATIFVYVRIEGQIEVNELFDRLLSKNSQANFKSPIALVKFVQENNCGDAIIVKKCGNQDFLIWNDEPTGDTSSIIDLGLQHLGKVLKNGQKMK